MKKKKVVRKKRRKRMSNIKVGIRDMKTLARQFVKIHKKFEHSGYYTERAMQVLKWQIHNLREDILAFQQEDEIG